MDLLDDDGLTNGTLTLSNARDGTLVVACGAIAREILAVSYTHLTLPTTDRV